MTTFSELDRASGNAVEGGDSPLARWYTQVAAVPLAKLSLADLIRALRQNVHLPQTAAEAIARLAKDPQAGDAYDYELVLTLSAIGEDFWREHPSVAATAASAAAQIDALTLDDDERNAFTVWRKAVTALSRGKAVLRLPGSKSAFPLSLLEETSVGSGRAESVCLPGLGRRHFVIRCEDQGFVLYAQGDALRVNGKDVADKQPLRSGDEIQAGTLSFRFEETR